MTTWTRQPSGRLTRTSSGRRGTTCGRCTDFSTALVTFSGIVWCPGFSSPALNLAYSMPAHPTPCFWFDGTADMGDPPWMASVTVQVDLQGDQVGVSYRAIHPTLAPLGRLVFASAPLVPAWGPCGGACFPGPIVVPNGFGLAGCSLGGSAYDGEATVSFIP